MRQEKAGYGGQEEEGRACANMSPATLRASCTFLTCSLVTLVYFLSAKLGLAMAFEQANTSPVWPPTGFAIAALLYFGLKAWPAIFVGALITNLLTGVSIPVAMGIAIGNSLEGVVASYLILRFTARIPFDEIFQPHSVNLGWLAPERDSLQWGFFHC